MKNVRYQFARLCLGLGLFALAPFSVVNAQTPSDVLGPFVPLPMDYFETAGRVKVVQPINHLTLSGGRRLFDTADLDTDGGSGVRAKGGGNIRNPSGNDLGVQTTSRIPNGTAGGAIGRATGKIVKGFLGPTLGTGLAVWELYKELGFDLTKDAAGEPVVRKLDSSLCTVAPCYKYRILDYNGSYAAYQTTPSKSCEAALPSFPTSLGAQYVLLGTTNPTYQCKFTAWDGSNLFTRQVEYESTPAVAQQYFPSSQQEFIDAVAAKSGWPSTSALSRALADAVSATGEKLSTGTPTVSGPATSPGTTSVTNNTTNNTTKTETVTHHHTYAGDTVTTTNVTNVTVINNTTGDTISNETTTSTSKPETTSDQCKDYPDSAGCAKLGQISDSEVLNKKTEVVSVVAVAFAGGSCPPPVTFSVMSQSHSFSYDPLCDRLAVLKFLFLAIAGVLAAFILADSFKV